MIEKLQEIGLTSYEAKIYLALLEYGRMHAREIAEKSTVPITAIYPNVKTLQEKKFLQKFSGETAQFEALPPSVAFPSYIEKRKLELDKNAKNIVQESELLLGKKKLTTEKEVLTLSLGKEASSVIYHESLKRVTNSYYILGWHFIKVRDKYGFLQDFKQAISKGVDVRIILTGPTDKEWSLIKTYQEAGVKLKYLPIENFSLVIVDENECKITLKNKAYAEKFNLHVKDQALAQAMQSYFLSMWKKAIPIEEIRP